MISDELPKIFPNNCSVYACRSANDSVLFEEEKELVKKFTEKPKEQFCMGRYAAHLCLKDHGQNQAILRKQSGAPNWPYGIVGSITHTKGLAIAVTGSSDQYLGLGIDCERLDRKIKLMVAEKTLHECERSWVFEKEGKEELRLLHILSAKEAIFKAFYPINECYLGFLDAMCTKTENGFVGKLLKQATPEWDCDKSFEISTHHYEDYLISSLYLLQ